MNESSNQQISVVIATADRPGIVVDCLNALAKQLPNDVEVVVVDGGQEQPVDDKACRDVWPNTRVIRSEVRNAGLQRNRGVKEAKGVLIIFVDDDSTVQEGWWPGIVAPLAPGCRMPDAGCRASDVLRSSTSEGGANRPAPIGAVAGGVWVNPNPELISRRGGYVNLLGEPIQIVHRGVDAPRDVDWPLTTNMAIRKSVFEEVGGFCGAYGIYDEDVDLGLKIRRTGQRIVFEPAATVYHYYNKLPRRPTGSKKHFQLGRNRSMLLVRHYGVSLRLILFFLAGPWMRLHWAASEGLRRLPRNSGGVVMYVAGMMKGLVDGVRHPVSGDKRAYAGD